MKKGYLAEFAVLSLFRSHEPFLYDEDGERRDGSEISSDGDSDGDAV